MSQPNGINSREVLYQYFDRYTQQKKDELSHHSIEPGRGLLKTYVIETSALLEESNIPTVYRRAGWKLAELDEDLYSVGGLPEGMDGFLDVLSPRYSALYTTSKSAITDVAVKKTVRESTDQDHAWFASSLLDSVWRELPNERTSRLVNLVFEHEPRFERLYTDTELDDLGKDVDTDDEVDEESTDTEQRQTVKLEIRERIPELKNLLRSDSPLASLAQTGNLIRVRMPAPNEMGRYEFFHYGKVTDRGAEFVGFAAQLRFFIERIYGELTRRIEQTVSFHIEQQRVSDGDHHFKIRGAPVTFLFSRHLSSQRFNAFVRLTFEKGRGPFRLWGNPIRLSGPKVHVYGLDLHLWQQIYLDMSPKRFIVVLPKDTCGNTVHRLATNIQLYLDPQVSIFIGDTPYEDIINSAWRNA